MSKDGYRFAVSFTDDFSSAVFFVYFLKQKSDAVYATEKFLADTAPYGKIKCLRCDNDTEIYVKRIPVTSQQKWHKIRDIRTVLAAPERHCSAELEDII